jgi:hypothetical protein
MVEALRFTPMPELCEASLEPSRMMEHFSQNLAEKPRGSSIVTVAILEQLDLAQTLFSMTLWLVMDSCQLTLLHCKAFAR